MGRITFCPKYLIMLDLDSKSIKTRIASVIVFAIAMGILEAITVVYIRKIIFPPAGIITNNPTTNFNFTIEAIREAMTIIMLAGVSILAAYNWRTRIAMFFIAFGFWDIFYYVGLKLLLDWPASIMDWDTLFLIPVAWYSPVLVPVLISIYFIIGGIFIIMHEGNSRKLKFSLTVIILQLLALITWYYSFVHNSDNISKNGYQDVQYSWVLFCIGLIFGIISLYLSKKK